MSKYCSYHCKYAVKIFGGQLRVGGLEESRARATLRKIRNFDSSAIVRGAVVTYFQRKDCAKTKCGYFLRRVEISIHLRMYRVVQRAAWSCQVLQCSGNVKDLTSSLENCENWKIASGYTRPCNPQILNLYRDHWPSPASLEIFKTTATIFNL